MPPSQTKGCQRLEALYQKHPNHNSAPNLLSEDGREWLASGLNKSLGLLMTPEGIVDEDHIRTVRLCLSRRLIEPLPKDVGVCYRLTEEGRREAWLIKIDRLKSRGLASRFDSADEHLQTTVSERQNTPSQIRRNEESTSPHSLEEANFSRSGEEVFSCLRKQAALKLSPIHIAKENCQKIIRRVGFSIVAAMLLFTVGIGLGLSAHWVMKDPISLIAVDTLRDHLSIAPAAGPTSPAE